MPATAHLLRAARPVGEPGGLEVGSFRIKAEII